MEANQGKGELNSPRSLDACKRQGIDKKELMFVSIDEYKKRVNKKNLEADLIKLRWEHHEEKRKEKLRVLIEVILLIYIEK